ncbi:hypothetical protein GCM10010922_09500 [Microbacterium sorbitolivorans]|uniref:Nucleoside hydrolase n=1 Tax=Microbacterium sorbitolivorans TaxID=1867410 RepID=A0A367XXT7_9MICO|nr:nucleoside hydrolase [Microbacterium sorbitolivorans]RCK58426.1 nucleoside hydrolase [Microbacterium sorbitolivorans]GGF36419.1 hypothetical protein GCM10010922_09500 [Microbacterium sorbitolivorans]
MTRARVIVDNDFSADPDDLVQLAHQALSPSADLRFVIGSHLRPGDGFDPSATQAANAAAIARDLLARCGRDDVRVLTGSEIALVDGSAHDTEAARAIIAEALRDDTDAPLYYCAGAGLTDLASALLLEPSIASRITLVWIGGLEYEHATPPPQADPVEYNLAIDIPAAGVVFDQPEITIWQLPRDSYRRALMSFAEINTRIRPHGELGAYLADSLASVAAMVSRHGMDLGETYVLGDSPLVLLSTLQSSFQPSPSSSTFHDYHRPAIAADGTYAPRAATDPAAESFVRVYDLIDNRLMFDDLVAKLALHAAGNIAAAAPAYVGYRLAHHALLA